MHMASVLMLIADLSKPQDQKKLLADCADPDILIHNAAWPETDSNWT